MTRAPLVEVNVVEETEAAGAVVETVVPGESPQPEKMTSSADMRIPAGSLPANAKGCVFAAAFSP